MGCGNSKAAAPAQQTKPLASTLLETDKALAEQKPAGDFKLRLGATFPDFECETTQGSFRFHDFLGREGQPPWTVLFTHPKDFAPVSTTELAICSSLVAKFAQKGAKLIGLSCGAVSEHAAWSEDVLAVKDHHTGFLGSLLERAEDALGLGERELGFPLIADEKREISSMLGLLEPHEKDAAEVPTSAHGFFVIGPDKTNRATILYPSTTGCSFVEALRLVDSLLLTQGGLVATPANWKPKERVVLSPAVETEEARTKFGGLEVVDMPSGKQYIRYVDCPSEPAQQSAADQGPCQLVAGAQDFKVRVGATLFDFECKTTDGDFRFHEFLDREPSWTLLITHPKAFSPVSTTELGVCHSMAAQFKELGVKMIALSCDAVSEQQSWSKDILAAGKADEAALAFPLIADESREIASRLGVLDPSERDTLGLPMPARALFVIAPDKTNRATILYPSNVGRNFDEVLRLVRSLQMTDNLKLATPGNWEKGDRAIVMPELSTEEAQEKFSHVEVKELPSKKPYLRCVDCPSTERSVVEPLPEPEGGAQSPQSSTSVPLQALTEVPDSRTACCC